MKPLHVKGPRLNTFERNMLVQASIEGLLPLDTQAEGREHEPCYSLAPDLQALDRLLAQGTLSEKMLMQLIEDMLTLDAQLNAHLLAFYHLSFLPQHIFWSPIKHRFYFAYLSHPEEVGAYQCMSLYRHLIIEQFKLTPKLLKHLQIKHFDLMAIKHHLGAKKRLGLFKLQHTLPSIEHPTIQQSTKSCLIDKANPSSVFSLFFHINAIGRDDENNICINHASVSRKHAHLIQDQQQHYIKDLNSHNGTRVNGIAISTTTQLQTGDIISFGDKDFIFIR